MHLVQLLLPLYDERGESFPLAQYAQVREELMAAFEGLTAYVRSPAKGLWKEEDGQTVRDDVVIYEVMIEKLDRRWWETYGADLRRRFKQEELVIRAQEIERL